MTGKTITIHSCRGGTGKSLIAVNLAIILARKGLNIALLDLDFRAPSLATVFSKDDKGLVNWWLNDFLNGKCTTEQVVIDVSGKYNLEGRLLIGLANPSIEAIRAMADKSSSWEVAAVKRIFSLLSSLFKEMSIDCCIVDTSPGVQYSSINAVVSSDVSVVITTLDSLDLKGTRNMLFDLYDPLERKTVVLVNKYSPETRLFKDERPENTVSRVEENLKHPVIGVIPCFCDVLQQERSAIMAVKDPTHQFVRNLEEVADNLRKMAQIC
jgi:MinD-like ATPase involved in chromosome partitioning or flagellar assembly